MLRQAYGIRSVGVSGSRQFAPARIAGFGVDYPSCSFFVGVVVGSAGRGPDPIQKIVGGRKNSSRAALADFFLIQREMSCGPATGVALEQHGYELRHATEYSVF
jgi:hypothetical protein